MLGMAPHGAVTFMSALYQGSISNTDIFRQSGITSFLTPDMAIKAGRFLAKCTGLLYCTREHRCCKKM